jgi:hypothetical protein
MKWLGDYRAAAYVEHERFADLATAKIYCYNLPIPPVSRICMTQVCGLAAWRSNRCVAMLFSIFHQRSPLVAWTCVWSMASFP